MKQLKFQSPKKMLDVILGGEDLYNTEKGIYVFNYSEAGSIAVYSLDNLKAKKLAMIAEKNDDYWGSFLGAGGRIFDDPNSELFRINSMSNLAYCERVFNLDSWYKTADLQEEWKHAS